MDVPDYQAQETTFQKELAGALGTTQDVNLVKTDPMHLRERRGRRISMWNQRAESENGP